MLAIRIGNSAKSMSLQKVETLNITFIVVRLWDSRTVEIGNASKVSNQVAKATCRLCKGILIMIDLNMIGLGPYSNSIGFTFYYEAEGKSQIGKSNTETQFGL